MKPMIGVTPSPITEEAAYGTIERYALTTTYVNAVVAAGGVPLVLPPQEADVGALLDVIDGLLLSGGADIDPCRYDDRERHPTTYGIDPSRDQFELDLLAGALERDMPTFCICRGIQVLNVALGGTLVQDIAGELSDEGSIQHRQHEVGIEKEEAGHDVSVAEGTLLAGMYGASRIGVNSFHHQAIKRLGADLNIEAQAADGVIEAVTLADRSFVVGVQWHPEMMFERHKEHLEPFVAHVQAAAARKYVEDRV